MEQEEKENKKTNIIIIFVIIIITLCAIIMVTSILHPTKNTNTKKQEEKTNIKEEVNPEKIEEIKEEAKQPKGKPFSFDTSSYKIDSRLEPYELNLAVQISSKNFEKNLLDDDKIRITILNSILIKNKEVQHTSDKTRQQSMYVSKELYEQRFKELYGNNYDYEKTVTDVKKGMHFDSCENYPEENDGTKYCIGPAASAISYMLYIYTNINEQVINNEKIITGEYYVKETDTTYNLHGTLEIKYTLEDENQYLKSIILNNIEDYT